jgi:hypothetical protein
MIRRDEKRPPPFTRAYLLLPLQLFLVLQPPLPLQEFFPLQPLSPDLQPPLPLQEFFPLQECLSSLPLQPFLPLQLLLSSTCVDVEALPGAVLSAALTLATVPVSNPAMAALAMSAFIDLFMFSLTFRLLIEVESAGRVSKPKTMMLEQLCPLGSHDPKPGTNKSLFQFSYELRR